MATGSVGTTLDSTYTSLINYQIQMESQPLTRLTNQQNALKLQRAVYNDLKTKLDSLRSVTKTLISTDPFYALKPGRQIAITNVATGSTVLSASASSSAIPSSYDITEIKLATADRVLSDVQEYSDQALGKVGNIYLGGAVSRSAEAKSQTVSRFATGTVAEGNTKLDNGSYFVETRKEGSVWQFRLVNGDGVAQNIGETNTDAWQAIPTGGTPSFDTNRGLVINFGENPDKYTAQTKLDGSAANVNFSSTGESLSITSEQNTVGAFATEATIDEGQLELGTGTYFVETQKNASGTWQFRLVDSEGTAMKIATPAGTSYTNSWQTIPTDGAAYSTGRGLSINFGTDANQFVAKSKLGGAAGVTYQSKGAEIAITSDMSLNDIAYAINKGTFAAGNEMTATIVNKQLVLSSKLTGLTHKLQASGEVLETLGVLTGSNFKNIMQSAGDASFKVNGLPVTRSQNSALTDVISGVTLNLASDAQGKTATINITADNTTSKNAITSFLTNFNSLQTYLGSKIAVTKQTDGTYQRGSLAGDQSIIGLRTSLFSQFNSYDATGGVYKSLKAIGIEINSSMTAVISDSSKLDTALKTNFSEVTKLLDKVVSSMDAKLTKYTGTNSYVSQIIKSNETQTTSVASLIKSWNARIEQRKTSLTNQYVEVQAQLTTLSYTQNTNTAWINSLTSLYS